MKIRSSMKPVDSLTGETGAGQNLLLVILALLIALLGYLYFFTGVIKERELQQSTAPETVSAVKQPIPPRPPAVDARVAPPSPQVAKKPQPAVSAVSAVPVKQPARPAEPEKAAKKAANVKPAAAKTSPSAKYRVVASGISSPTRADAVAVSLKKWGGTNIERKEAVKEKTMKRLFVAVFKDSQAAHTELQKVRKISAGAFLITAADSYELYAGSYDNESRAGDEVKRLSRLGLNVSIRKTVLNMPVTTITAAALDKKSAGVLARRLAKLGVQSEAVKEE